MRLVPLALLVTSCDLANPCAAGEGSFELYFAGDLEGSGWLEIDAIPRIAGAPARLTGGGVYGLVGADDAGEALSGGGSLDLAEAACARRDSTATFTGGHISGAVDAEDSGGGDSGGGDSGGGDTGGGDSGGGDTGGGADVALTLSLRAQKGGWSGTWSAIGPDGASAEGQVVAAAR